jgi:S-formylglutathione hydrolase FrmB
MRNIDFTGRSKAAVMILALFIFSTNAIAAHIDTLVVMSKVMNKSITNIAIIPDDYDEQNEYPVLYMLHGAGGDYSSWLRISGDLPKYADEYGFIIILPDGGRTSWYFDSPFDPAMQYETYVASELVEVVDSRYKTIKKREARAITGLSMGGHGAFYLSFKHTDIWGAAGSMSGGLDIRPFPKRWDIALRLGIYAENKELWDKNTLVNMVDLIVDTDTRLIFDCGVDDFFYAVNQQMHENLLAQKIPHDYIERPGGHRLEYWQNAVKYQLLFFNEYFSSGAKDEE